MCGPQESYKFDSPLKLGAGISNVFLCSTSSPTSTGSPLTYLMRLEHRVLPLQNYLLTGETSGLDCARAASKPIYLMHRQTFKALIVQVTRSTGINPSKQRATVPFARQISTPPKKTMISNAHTNKLAFENNNLFNAADGSLHQAGRPTTCQARRPDSGPGRDVARPGRRPA